MKIIRLPAMLLISAFLLGSVIVLASRPAPAAGQEAVESSASAAQPQRLTQDDPFVVHDLTSLAMLRDQFNHDYGRPRLILLLSPT